MKQKSNSKKQRFHYNAFSFDFKNSQNFQNFQNYQNQFLQNCPNNVNNQNTQNMFAHQHVEQKQIVQKGFNCKKKFKYWN